ncbi:MAG: hypothetical protein EBX40_00635 [Gammaproteobacteria bacterium]|nr:hypothetical protein [Gammaproteobacteria bacterium]
MHQYEAKFVNVTAILDTAIEAVRAELPEAELSTILNTVISPIHIARNRVQALLGQSTYTGDQATFEAKPVTHMFGKELVMKAKPVTTETLTVTAEEIDTFKARVQALIEAIETHDNTTILKQVHNSRSEAVLRAAAKVAGVLDWETCNLDGDVVDQIRDYTVKVRQLEAVLSSDYDTATGGSAAEDFDDEFGYGEDNASEPELPPPPALSASVKKKR